MALTLAGAKRDALGVDADLAVAAPARTLLRRRGDADEAQRKLASRRDDAEPGRGGAPGRPEQPVQPTCGDPGRPDASRAAPLLPAPALERLALEAGRIAGRPSVEMSFGRDLHVRLTRSPRGVELVLAPRDSLWRAAVAELPRIVEALRARGVSVEKAEVRPGGAAGGPPGALTPRRTSDTNPATSDPAGTVAKW